MNTSTASNASGSRYDQLLATVQELHTSLQQAMSTCQGLKAENKLLRDNYANAKEELLTTRRRYNEVNKSYLQSVQEKIEAERQNEALLHKWKVQLEQKSKEFEEWQTNLVPQDLDMLRIKIQEELEIPHMQKVQGLQSEIESLRQLTHKIRTEKVWLQTELERTVHERTRDMEEMKNSYDQAKAEFKRKLVECEQQMLERDYTEETRRLRQQLNESEAICNKYKATTEEYRQKLEQETLHRDKGRVHYSDLVTRLEAKMELADQSSKAAQATAIGAEVQLQAREKQALKPQERNRELEEELSRTKNEYRALKSSMEDHRRRVAEEYERMRHEDRAELDECRKLVDQLNGRLSDREDSLRQAMKEIAELQRRSELAEINVKRSAQAKVVAMQQQLSDTDASYVALQEAVRNAEKERTVVVDGFKAQIEGLKGEITRLNRDKDALHAKTRMQHDKIDALANLATGSKGELSKTTELYQRAQNALQRCESKLQETERKYYETREELQSTRQQLEEAQQTHEQRWKQLKAEITDKYEKIERQYLEEIKTLKANAGKALAKERKRTQLYKEKALEAHGKVQQAKRAIAEQLHSASSARTQQLIVEQPGAQVSETYVQAGPYV